MPVQLSNVFNMSFRTIFLGALAVLLAMQTTSAYSKNHVGKVEPNLAPLYIELVKSLRQGGQHIYLAPPLTNKLSDDKSAKAAKDCSSELISDAGQAQIANINRSLAQLGVPIGLVMSSEVCVSMTAATYVVGNPSIKVYPTPDLDPPAMQAAEGHSNAVILEKIRGHFQSGTWEGRNAIFSGHRMTPETALHPVMTELMPGEAVIFKVNARSELDLMARLTSEQWAEMADYLGAKPKKKVRKSAK